MCFLHGFFSKLNEKYVETCFTCEYDDCFIKQYEEAKRKDLKKHSDK